MESEKLKKIKEQISCLQCNYILGHGNKKCLTYIAYSNFEFIPISFFNKQIKLIKKLKKEIGEE